MVNDYLTPNVPSTHSRRRTSALWKALPAVAAGILYINRDIEKAFRPQRIVKEAIATVAGNTRQHDKLQAAILHPLGVA